MEHTIKAHFSLARYRAGMRMTQPEAAEKAGIHAYTIRRFEKGDAIRRINAAKYLNVLGIEINHPDTWPQGLRMIDVGMNVKVDSD